MVLLKAPLVSQLVRASFAITMLIFWWLASHYGIQNALFEELVGAILAIENVVLKGWNHLWLECDSVLVVYAFKNETIVPWKLKNRWRHCIALAKNMNFLVGHIYCGGNTCVDLSASEGVNTQDFYGGTPLLVSLEQSSVEIELVSLTIGSLKFCSMGLVHVPMCFFFVFLVIFILFQFTLLYFPFVFNNKLSVFM